MDKERLRKLQEVCKDTGMECPVKTKRDESGNRIIFDLAPGAKRPTAEEKVQMVAMAKAICKSIEETYSGFDGRGIRD